MPSNLTTKIINKRYKILSLLNNGSMSITYRAKDLSGNSEVFLKAISLRQAKDWKTLDLFKREAQTLKYLEHPNIPKYLDYFEMDTDSDRYFYLVQEFIPGTSLSELVGQNWQYDRAMILQIAKQVLKILTYLHGLTPPVIHRDIKPDNLIWGEDKQIYLVDFGSIQSRHRSADSLVNTFVGTFGYIPPEQFLGHVSPTSDLYSLGCTLLFLLTKRLPGELPLDGLKMDFRSQIRVTKGLGKWLDKILEYAPQDRFQSAEEALRELPSPPPKLSSSYLSQDATIVRTPVNSPHRIDYLESNNNTLLIKSFDSDYFQPQSLRIEGQIFILKLGSKIGTMQTIKGQVSDLTVCNIKKEFGEGQQNICCALYDGSSFYRFGSELNSQQQQEVVEEISNFIDSNK